MSMGQADPQLARYYAELNISATWKDWTLAWARAQINGEDRVQVGDDIRLGTFIESLLLEHFSREVAPEILATHLPKGATASTSQLRRIAPLTLAVEGFRAFVSDKRGSQVEGAAVMSALQHGQDLYPEALPLVQRYEEARMGVRPSWESVARSPLTLIEGTDLVAHLLRARLAFGTASWLAGSGQIHLSDDFAAVLDEACDFALLQSYLPTSSVRFWQGIEAAALLTSKAEWRPESIERVVDVWALHLGSETAQIVARNALEGALHSKSPASKSPNSRSPIEIASRRLESVDTSQFFGTHLVLAAGPHLEALHTAKLGEPERRFVTPYEAGARVLGEDGLAAFKAAALSGFEDTREWLLHELGQTEWERSGTAARAWIRQLSKEPSFPISPDTVRLLLDPTTATARPDRTSFNEVVAVLERRYGQVCQEEDRRLASDIGSDASLRASIRNAALGPPLYGPAGEYCYLATQGALAATLSGVKDRFCVFESDLPRFEAFHQAYSLTPDVPVSIIPAPDLRAIAASPHLRGAPSTGPSSAVTLSFG